MKRVALFVAALGLMSLFHSSEVSAHGPSRNRSSFGITVSNGPVTFGYNNYGGYSGQNYGGCGYSGYRYVAPAYPRGHYDYHPPVLVPHGNHYDYIPGHYDYHVGGHGRYYGW